MIRVVVAGAAGRMGQRIVHMVHNHPELVLSGAFEQSGSGAIGKDVGAISGLGEIGVKITEGVDSVLDRADVLIDFTFHAVTVQFARRAAESGTAMVIGTTGLTSEELTTVRTLAEGHFPCVQSPNMAVGVNVLFKLVEKAAGVLGDAYDVEIVEAHHRLKKDAPSGTALKLGQMAATALGRDLAEVGVMERNGIIGERSDREIGIQTIRGGDIVGEHTVYFAGMGERLEITHRATNRDNFARGAVLAAHWVVSQPKGLYTMFDVLGLHTF
ncbi:4-hydroxy-tetrahydrodipicolinate reductase [Desulfobulbus oligotrophicus]|jgi:4-hydroxy-tetrahydrodipicolinate reductase|uniref:4-hydroxy-tetrahydrodipicolinate reductase n=1 Tax=Desulfobulbus oligotrophicus TaxID=1909699 RepID=A0A7T6APS0_9BACT|nr:4-hydroxy-tetrahydrodipicolinate reductase [Desulfobulbus oligotrophicus]MDY0390547.1 4-hydroxy-tetrahydrodipicolinate reductase [Desulfobulbus oligotrophicus]QQG64837.1 4-hydroxy-tetrahydrodipicolinate reductase [Desulfobulbus oligotrophicus]